MGIYQGAKDVVITAGGTFAGNRPLQFTVLTAAEIQDADGNVFGSYDVGVSYEGVFPRGTFTVATGSIKIWA